VEPPKKRQRTEANPEKRFPEIDLVLDQSIVDALLEED